MILLSTILQNIETREKIGFADLEIRNIVFDSREVEENSLFVAVKGTQVDGHAYINKAINSGARVIVAEELPAMIDMDIVYILVEDSSITLGKLAANYYGNPTEKLKIVGITGTNGKTTTATMLFDLFKNLGYSCGLISTVENRIIHEVIPSTHTTPDAVSLQKLFAEMLLKGCTHCFMEVSSHSLVQNRVAAVDFDGAVFTNITHDHLDYHKTFDEYIKAKKILFDQLSENAFALVNQDDKRGPVMLQNTKAAKHKYAVKSMAEFKAKIVEDSLTGLQLEIDKQEAWFKLSGMFNAYNILSVYSVGVLLGEDKQELLAELSALEPVNGRFEKILSKEGTVAIIDYAHTPDALKNVLETVKKISENGLVITVVGCGGNRDKDKRPMMASIAAKYSDQVIMTSDNPRDEDPKDILDQMREGLDKTQVRKVLTIEDRAEAIKTACTLAQPNDIVLVAGKGHEKYQEIKGEKFPFDDKQIVTEIFNN